MNKLVFATLVAIAGLSGILAYQSQTESSDVNMLTLANVEALTQIEEVSDYCYSYCKNRNGYVCWVKTSAYTVYCDEMVAWNYYE
ncbi:MAG: NVEALA domain-containing protein [Staphylococcus sp.]|nr:NVEALA domain-containing protein [Staphylococcus sp.]